MNYFLLNLLLALTWVALSGGFTPANFLVGSVLGFIALRAASLPLGRTDYFRKVPRFLALVAFFLAELFVANLRVAADVLSPRWRLRPRVVAIPLDAKTDIEITLLANLYSLTPGSLSLDVSSDRRVLYIHAMYAEDAEQVRRRAKQGFERRLLGVMRGTGEEEAG